MNRHLSHDLYQQTRLLQPTRTITGSTNIDLITSNPPGNERAESHRARRRSSEHGRESHNQIRHESWHNSTQPDTHEKPKKKHEKHKPDETKKKHNKSEKKQGEKKKHRSGSTHKPRAKDARSKQTAFDSFDEELFVGMAKGEADKSRSKSGGLKSKSKMSLHKSINKTDPSEHSMKSTEKPVGGDPNRAAAVKRRPSIEIEVFKEIPMAKRLVNIPMRALAVVIELHLIWWLVQLLMLVWMTTRVDWQLRVRSPLVSWPGYSPSRMPWLPGQINMRNRLYAVWISLGAFYLPLVILHMTKYVDYIPKP
ncbi:unnamed protein product [Echinostoma caproni]|uniref:DUF3533 domain-containing protein n=1 Tax=Echinostoma caproni TaxID=27848 RepID=A0A183BAN7_9TREM|nr:unnamed protein product [Echinostoma caproni]